MFVSRIHHLASNDISQQVITAVLPRSQLNDHCEFAPKPLYNCYVYLKKLNMLSNGINHMKMEFCLCIPHYHMEGSVSQIFYLGLRFCFMKKI